MYYNAQAAYNRKVTITKSVELIDNVMVHVCKIGLYPDDENVNHWANEVSGWIRKIDSYLSSIKGAKYTHAMAMSTIVDHVFFNHEHKSKQDLLEDIEHTAWLENNQKDTRRQLAADRVVRLLSTLVEAAHLKHPIKPFLILFSKEKVVESQNPRFD
jgi:hypothetical protein